MSTRTYLGSIQLTADNGGNVTLDLTTFPGGALQRGDVVVVGGSAPNRGGSEASTSSSGWTARGTKSSASDISALLWFKVMGSTPDTSFVLVSTANANDSASCQAMAWRDADVFTPWDVTPTVVITESGADPNPPSITTVTDNCDIGVMAFSAINDLPSAAPSGYSDLDSIDANDTEDVTAMLARKTQTSAGAEDPGAFSGVASADYVAFTFAIRDGRGITMPADPTTGGSLNGSDVALTLPAGSENDVMVVGCAVSSAVNGGTSSGGWTQLEQNDNTERLTVLYKRMGSSPDTSITLVGTANANDSLSALAYVLRGVDATTPVDVAATEATGSSTNPNPAAITPATTGAVIIPFAASRVHDPSITVQAGYTNLATTSRDDTNDASIAASTRTGIASVSEDPAAFGGWSTGLWATITTAWRPATAAAIEIDVDAAAYNYTATAASLEQGYEVEAAGASYTYTAQAAAMRHGYPLSAAAAAYLYGAQAATLEHDHRLSAAAASYLYGAQDASLEQGSLLSADSTSYLYSAGAATMVYGHPLSAAAAAYLYTEQAASLEQGYEAAGDSASYLYTAQAASLEQGYLLSAETAAYQWTPQDVTLTHAIVGAFSLAADSAAYVYTAQAASLETGREVATDTVAYTYSAQAATLARVLSLSADSILFSWTPQDATLTYTPVAAPGPVLVPGGGPDGVWWHSPKRRKKSDPIGKAVRETVGQRPSRPEAYSPDDIDITPLVDATEAQLRDAIVAAHEMGRSKVDAHERSQARIAQRLTDRRMAIEREDEAILLAILEGTL